MGNILYVILIGISLACICGIIGYTVAKFYRSIKDD